MELKVEVDTSKVIAAFLKAPKVMARTVRVAMKEVLTDVQIEAQQYHRYKTKSTMLEKSVKVDVSPSGLFGKVFLDRAIAIYGPRIHRGWGTWEADRFITSAFRRNKPNIVDGIKRAIARGIER